MSKRHATAFPLGVGAATNPPAITGSGGVTFAASAPAGIGEPDAGLEQIAGYEAATIEAHMDRFIGAPADVVARELAAVTRLAAARAAVMREQYLANRARSRP